MNPQQPLRSHEYGGVLITGLLTLIVLTAIGFAASRSSLMENEISINERNHKEAFYAAEIAMQTAEDSLKPLIERDDYETGDGRYPKDDRPKWEDLMTWHHTSSYELLAFPTGSQPFPEQPRYTIGPFYDPDFTDIGIKPTEGTDFFTVVAQGTGAKKDAKAFVTSIFAKRFDRR